MAQSRFSRQRSTFASQIRVLDTLQLSDGIAPGTKKWQDWDWSSGDSDYVTKTRSQSDDYMLIIDSDRHCPPEVKDNMKLLIAGFMDYDHGKINGRRLLDKIALNGVVGDWEILGIKRGTPLAKAPVHGGSGNLLVSKLKATVSMRRNTEMEHILNVRNAETPDSSALPAEVSQAQVFCYIGKDAPTKYSQYELIGNAKRGIFKNSFNGLEISTERLFAWYYVRYLTKKGELLEPSKILKAEIYFPVA